LAALLRELPADFPVPVLVVQHMADGFIDGLADWLGLMCRLPVVVARAGERLRPGTVAVAPNGVNVMLDDELRVVTEPAPPRQYHVPAIDVAFVSVAQRLGPDAIGVLLTGMGRDGAVGLRAMHDRGASTFVQDPESCAVYGMPAAAVALHAADAQLPPREIARELRRLVAARRLGSRRGS
jgi:chemotaxis response regulator CheB